MPADIVYDKDGKQVPSREYLSTLIILFRRSGVEVGMSFMQFIEKFEDIADLDLYDDKALAKTVQKYMFDNYPEMKPPQKKEG